MPAPVVAEPVPKKKQKGFFGRIFGGNDDEEEKWVEDYKISGPIKDDFKHV